MSKKNHQYYFRTIHRYLGFFLAGIMIVYVLSGITLIYRDTDLFKVEKTIEKKITAQLKAEDLGEKLRLRNLKVVKVSENIIYFDQGTYNIVSGEVKYISKELPFLLEKMTSLHKVRSKSPLHYFNLFFALSLFFFVVSAFLMFKPKAPHFKKGLYFALFGFIFTIILLFIY